MKRASRDRDKLPYAPCIVRFGEAGRAHLRAINADEVSRTEGPKCQVRLSIVALRRRGIDELAQLFCGNASELRQRPQIGGTADEEEIPCGDIPDPRHSEDP